MLSLLWCIISVYIPGFWLENLRYRDNLEDLGVDGRIILKLMLSRIGGRRLD